MEYCDRLPRSLIALDGDQLSAVLCAVRYSLDRLRQVPAEEHLACWPGQDPEVMLEDLLARLRGTWQQRREMARRIREGGGYAQS